MSTPFQVIVYEPMGTKDDPTIPRTTVFTQYSVPSGTQEDVLRLATSLAMLIALEGSLVCAYTECEGETNLDVPHMAVQIWRSPQHPNYARRGERIGKSDMCFLEKTQAAGALMHMHGMLASRATKKRVREAGTGAATTLGARLHAHASHGTACSIDDTLDRIRKLVVPTSPAKSKHPQKGRPGQGRHGNVT